MVAAPLRPGPASPPLIARGAIVWIVWALALSAGCGGAAPSPDPAGPGALPDPAAVLTVRPDPLLTWLRGLDARFEGEALGPLGAAWARVRQQLEDALAELAPADPATGAGVAAAWGLASEAPMVIELASPDGPALGRLLVRGLREGALPAPDGRLAWQLRAHLRLEDGPRLEATLDRLAGRFDWRPIELRAARRAWKHPRSGALAALRVRADAATFDVLMPVRAAPDGAVIGRALARSAPRRPPPDGRLVVDLGPAAVGALEVGLDLRRVSRPGVPLEALRATAALTGLCVDRWTSLARLASAVRFRLADGAGVGVRAVVRLTDTGSEAWRAAVGPLPLTGLEGLPAAAQLGLQARSFAEAAGKGPATLDAALEVRACGAGHPLTSAAFVLAWLPAYARPEALPVPGPAEGWDAAVRHRGVAAALLGTTPQTGPEGELVPALAGLVMGDVTGLPMPTAPAGAEPLPGGGWRLAEPGRVPIAEARRAVDGRAFRIFGVGDVAAGALAERIGPRAGDVFLEARLDAELLAGRLAAGGDRPDGVEALTALGRRFGVLSVVGRLRERQVEVTADLDPRPPAE